MTGYIVRIPFTEGADVKAGDLLFEIDPPALPAWSTRPKRALNKAQLKFSESALRRNVASTRPRQ